MSKANTSKNSVPATAVTPSPEHVEAIESVITKTKGVLVSDVRDAIMDELSSLNLVKKTQNPGENESVYMASSSYTVLADFCQGLKVVEDQESQNGAFDLRALIKEECRVLISSIADEIKAQLANGSHLSDDDKRAIADLRASHKAVATEIKKYEGKTKDLAQNAKADMDKKIDAVKKDCDAAVKSNVETLEKAKVAYVTLAGRQLIDLNTLSQKHLNEVKSKSVDEIEALFSGGESAIKAAVEASKGIIDADLDALKSTLNQRFEAIATEYTKVTKSLAKMKKASKDPTQA